MKTPVFSFSAGVGTLWWDKDEQKFYRQTTALYTPDGFTEIVLGQDDAGSITFTPAGTIAATDVQAALEELDTDIQAFSAFVGDSGAGGTEGLVPAPAAGDGAAGKYLAADGTWDVPSTSGADFSTFSGDFSTFMGAAPGSLTGADLRTAAGLSDGSITEDSFLIGAADGSVAEATAAEAATLMRAVPVGQRVVSMQCFAFSTFVTEGDAAGGAYWRVPPAFSTWVVVEAGASHGNQAGIASAAEQTNIQLRRVRAATPQDILSTPITIDSTELDSKDAAAPPVVNASYDDLAAGDLIIPDVDDTFEGTVPMGLVVDFTIQEPEPA